jgi:hypothetical protein
VSRRTPSRSAGALAAGLAALTLAACGSSTTSPAQLHAQATAICSRANVAIGRIATPDNASGGLAFLDNGIATLKPELAQLQQLHASGDAADVWNTALRSMASELSALESTAANIRGGADPVQAFKALQQTLTPLETQAANAWQALQIPACQNQ